MNAVVPIGTRECQCGRLVDLFPNPERCPKCRTPWREQEVSD